MDKEPDRYYDWMLWKFRKQKKKEKSVEDQVIGMGAGAGGRDISKEFQLPKPKVMSNATEELVRHLNRIEAKIDLLLSKSDGGLK
tara:strand:- start:795 stop:1049 length:255 start_codon:yes stop_codon:yes gene_type:complete